jgi:hypothetical protein
VDTEQDLLIGISIYNEHPDDKNLDRLELGYKNNPICGCCKSSLKNINKHHLKQKNQWINVCSFCYYTQNIDQIPLIEKGRIIIFPYMSQIDLNNFFKCLWVIDYLYEIDRDNDEIYSLKQTVEQINNSITGQLSITDSTLGVTNVDVYANFLGIINRDKYQYRHKLLRSRRWLPPKELFEDEIAVWADGELNILKDTKQKIFLEEFRKRNLPEIELQKG